MSKRVAFAFVLLNCLVFALLAQGAAAEAAVQGAASSAVPSSSAWKYISAALAVGFACIGGGIAVGRVGAAAMGAIAEDATLSGKAWD
jgi:V/A-type H+-transporting ATPase subunit K